MKTHIPATLRKALIAALFATASLASTSYAKAVDEVGKVVNWSESYVSPFDTFTSEGYTDLTFSGTNRTLGTVRHYVHSAATDFGGVDDYTYITLTPDEHSGKYIAYSVKAWQGKDVHADLSLGSFHDHSINDTWGYSTSWSNGSINVNKEAVLEVTTTIEAHNIIDITDASRVTVGGKVSAGEIRITDGASLTAENINVTCNTLWSPGDADYDSTGMLSITGAGTSVTVTGTVEADGAVRVGNSGTLYASDIQADVAGSEGYIVALEGQDLLIDGDVLSDISQYVVGEGCGILIMGDLGMEINEGSEDDPDMVMHGNDNRIGYSRRDYDGEIDTVTASWVHIGSIISNFNQIAANGAGARTQAWAPYALWVEEISGDFNSLKSVENCSLWVDCGLTGNSNYLDSNQDMHVNSVGRGYDEGGPALGNSLRAVNWINIGHFSDNKGLIIEVTDGGMQTMSSSYATLEGSKIEAEGDVLINYDKKSDWEKSSDVLTLTWNTNVTSTEGDIVINQGLRAGGAGLFATEGDITLYGGLRHVVDGVNDYGITVDTQNLYSGDVLELDGKTLDETHYYVNVVGDIRSDSDIFITDYIGGKSYVSVGGTMQTYGRVEVDNSLVNVDTRVVSDWNLIAKGGSHVTVNVGTEGLEEGETSVLDVKIIEVDETSTLRTGNVELDDADETIHGVVEAGVKDYSDPTKDIAADWKVTGSHDISGANAHLMANGDIEIVAAEEGDAIRIADGAKVSATGDVTIQGLAAALAEVEGANVRADGDIILGNAELKHNTGTDITTKGSDIVLKDTVVIRDTILNVLPPEEGDEGVINVTEGADVQIRRIDIITPSMANVDVFNGKLAGTGSVTAYDDNLTLYHDATAFNGTINLVRDDEQAINIACEGVGEDAVINLTEGSSLYTIVGGQGAHLGNVVATDGSHIQLTAVDEGNTASATTLCLTEGSTYDVFATAGAETGALVSDCITVTGGVDALGAKVAVHTTPAMDGMKDGSRFTIVAGDIATEFNEDVLYDRVRGIGGASTLRKLQTRNMHLEHNANGVDLVVSENYKAVDNSNANVNAVREIIMPLDAAADHRPGTLAQSTSNLDHILDALDYTRSGAAAKAGALSVSAAANLIVPNMMMDASRHHLSNLRDHMATPVCTKDYKSKGNVWAAYVGGHDFIGSDDNMGKYSHSYNGAIIGGDYAVNCNWAIGLSAGYQNSIARTDATRAESTIMSGDLYVVGRTGKFVHRFSMGMSFYNTDVDRSTRIAAKGHSYDAMSTGDADGKSWNFGYQVSRSYAINQVSAVTPYLTVDVALQRMDTLYEKGQGDASVVTDYDDFVQTDAALGVSYSHTFASFNQQAGVFAVDLALHGEFSEHRATAKNHFVDSPADTWKTRSAKRAPLYGELGGHVLVPFTQHFSGTAGLNFEFSDDRTYIGGHAGVNYRF
ncbi:MAG: autotransporter domain-containing protein [Akkermansia sp.]|nr:autotransporter domain-containing protein [Akkermansia sp.]